MLLLETYKAQRPPMPDPLREQVATVQEYLDRARIAWVRVEGEEADDVMASLSAWAAPDVSRILLATGDKDLYQLVDGKTSVVPVSGGGAAMGPEEVKAKTGVPPNRIVAWLALVGDAADNIPGVPGVGPKTAARLLERYGSLDGIRDHLDEVQGAKLRTSLAENLEAVSRNVQMVTLRTGLAADVGWEELAVREPEPDRLLPLFEELEFHSLVRDMKQQDLFDA
jgi:DNA polymerase-1